MRKLIQYKGGGYDGCFWEWNFFLSIKQPGKDRFINVASSGRFGIDCPSKQINLKDEEYYVYNLDDAESMAELARECNTTMLTGLIRIINNNLVDDWPIFAICDDCEKQIYDADDLEQEGWHGCGGIAVSSSEIICSACYSANQCNSCNEYAPDGELVEMADGDDVYLCSYCVQFMKDQELEILKQAVIHQSLCTGTPDWLGDDMRWFWESFDPEPEQLEELLCYEQ